MVTKLSRTSRQTFCFSWCSSAIAAVKAPFVMALLLPAFMAFIVFMAFMGMVLKTKSGEASGESDVLHWSRVKTSEDNVTL